MPPLVSILTPSYNKYEYVLEAINSVLNQSYRHFEYYLIDNSDDGLTRPLVRDIAATDSRIRYQEIDFTQAERQSLYIPAYIANQIYPELEGAYIFYLSDDDVLLPTAIHLMVSFLESTGHSVCYHQQTRLVHRAQKWFEQPGTTRFIPMGKDSNYLNVDCCLDGGQIMHRRTCLNRLDQPYFSEDLTDAPHCDGLFLQRLANLYTFYPVDYREPLSLHRVTPKSAWTKP